MSSPCVRASAPTTGVLNAGNILQQGVGGVNEQINSIIHSPRRDVCRNNQSVSYGLGRGLFSLTGVKCDFCLYQVIGECASKVICSIGSRSQHCGWFYSDGDLTFNNQAADPTTFKPFYLAIAPVQLAVVHSLPLPLPSTQGRTVIIIISYRGDISVSPDTRVNLMVMYPDGCMKDC